ncbi:MAG: DUF4234 domain-containing protein [Ethanoligenens sp.]
MFEASQEQKPYQASTSPIGQLNANRSLLKYILLGIITLGIYDIVCLSGISTDINIVASRYDGKKTMHYCLLLFVISPITLGIANLVWFHKLSNRIGTELQRRAISYELSATTFWLWGVLGALIVVGQFIYMHKLITASNKLAEHYNVHG